MSKKETKPTNTGEANVLAKFKETKQHITMNWFDSPSVVHEDIKGYSLNGPYLVVQMKDDTQFIYHMGNMHFIKINVTKE